MIFLGAASNYSKKAVFKHLFAFGTSNDAKKLKKALSDRYGAASDFHVALTNSGRSALALALKASVPRGSKVVVNGFTCHAVLVALKAANCTPIYADIEKSTLNYSPETLRKLLKKHPGIKAIIIQNTLGNTVDIAAFEKLAKINKFMIIEDLAHCAGRLYPDGRETGTVGDAIALSFGKGKSIDTITGGAVILRNSTFAAPKEPKSRPRLADSLRARWYPFFGVLLRASYAIHLYKILAGGLLFLRLIERSADTRLDLSVRPTYWQSKLALSQLSNLEKTSTTPIREFSLVKNREKTLKKLRENGYNFDEVWYDVPVSPARYYSAVHFPETDCPTSVEVSRSIVNIPTWYKKSDLKLAKKIIKEDEK